VLFPTDAVVLDVELDEEELDKEDELDTGSVVGVVDVV
jgi:hypothetical protein